ncbi:MAG: 3'-5' exonuclease [Cyclobacteriaceae bacterium]
MKSKVIYQDNISIPPEEFLVVDLEGTGDSKNNGIVELSIIYVKSKNDIKGYSWMFNPRKPITYFGTKVHGIKNSDVKDKPFLLDHADEILGILSDKPFVGHHCGVDIALLSNELPIWKPELVYDTFRLAKKYFPNKNSYKLTNLTESLGIEIRTEDVHKLFSPSIDAKRLKPHSAPFDTFATLKLFQRIITSKPKLDNNSQLGLF